MEIMVGTFMFMVLLTLGFFTIILSYENIFRTYHELEVRFEHVRGLRQGDNVFWRGVNVGRVKELAVDADGVNVWATLEQPVTMREGYRIEIVSSSMLGGQHLALDEGPPDAPPLPEGERLYGERPADLMADASEIVRSLREVLDEGEVLANLQSTMAQLNQITTDLGEGRGTIGRLLADDSLYENLEEVTASLRQVAGMLERGEGTIGALIQDDQLYNDLTEITSRLTAGQGTLGRLLADDDTLYEDLAATAGAIREITEKISQGEGTLGRMITDDDLYEEVKLLLHEVRAAVDDFRETAPITTFTSIFFGAF